MLTSTPETPEVTASERARGALFPSGNFLPFFLVTALFFLWGIPNNLNDVLIRQFMKSFAITRFQAGLIQSAFYMGYFLLAVPAALLMRKPDDRRCRACDNCACEPERLFCALSELILVSSTKGMLSS